MRRALYAAVVFLVGFNPALAEVPIEASTGAAPKNARAEPRFSETQECRFFDAPRPRIVHH
jgi:hypothetical protein